MKKVLAVVLALCMVFAMGTVAFAANMTITEETPAPQQDTVLVKTVLGEDPAEFDTYSVTIPADVEIMWDVTTPSEARIATVDYRLAEGSSLQVTVAYADVADDGLTSSMAGATASAVYTNGYATGVEALNNTFSITEWNAAPAAVTAGTATYTVNYTPAA